MFRSLLPSVRAARLLSTESVASSSYTPEEKPLKKVGRALETYIKLSKEHVSMMARERYASEPFSFSFFISWCGLRFHLFCFVFRADFELGKRHLANMMNLDPYTMTQDDIDRLVWHSDLVFFALSVRETIVRRGVIFLESQLYSICYIHPSCSWKNNIL